MASAEVDVQLVLVTGASGYIASHVVQQLLKNGYRVRGTVRSKKNATKVQHLLNLCPDAQHELELVEADLLDVESWKPAVDGCSHVIHVASPFPSEAPKHEDEIIKPALEGTLNVLKACQNAGTVKRVVVTSSIAAVSGGFTGESNVVFSEKDWPNVDTIGTYEKSKTLAEKAAWDFVDKLNEDEKFELAVINPAFVMGPMLSGSDCTSMVVLKKLLQRQMPALAKINFAVVDVRDVAEGHVKAMTLPEATGKRHIMCADNIWMKEIAIILEDEFKSQGYNVPTWVSPDIGIKFFALFDKNVRLVVSALGKVTVFDNARMREVLGVQPRSIKETVIDMSYSIIEGGFVPKKSKYHGPPKVEVKPTES